MKKASFLVLSVWAGVALAVENAAPADDLARQQSAGEVSVPLAPPGYRRPEGYVPVLYPRDLATLAREESSNMMARARETMARVDRVNSEGKWHATGKSIDGHKCPDWFIDAKLGIFIDWGPWSLASWCPYVKGARLYPDWYEFRCDQAYPAGHRYHGMVEYHKKNWGEDFKRDHFLDLFKASRFDAPALMKTFRACGAKYVVPFLKHHGGYCLWDSSFTHRDVMEQGPKRDLTREMVDACRSEGLKFGFYVSQAGEWEYPVLQADGSIKMLVESRPTLNPHTPDMEWKASGKVAVKDVVRDYFVPQVVEFIDKYDPDIFWGDYDWCTDATANGSYDMVAYLYNHAEGRKEVCSNDRFGRGTPEELKGKEHTKLKTMLRTVRGDFYTDEWGDAEDSLDPKKWHPWESCSGISKAYGNHWQETEDMVMDERTFICYFADIVARGGNLLLLVNLDPQGALVEHQRKRLLQIGAWLKTWGEAIYGTRILAPYKTDKIAYTRSKNGRYAYAIVKAVDRVVDAQGKSAAEVRLACELPATTLITVVGSGKPLAHVRDGKQTRVFIPAELASSSVPFALRCTRK